MEAQEKARMNSNGSGSGQNLEMLNSLRMIAGGLLAVIGAITSYLLYQSLMMVMDAANVPFSDSSSLVIQYLVSTHVAYFVSFFTLIAALGMLTRKRYGWILMQMVAIYNILFALEMLIYASGYLGMIGAGLGSNGIWLIMMYLFYIACIIVFLRPAGIRYFRLRPEHIVISVSGAVFLIIWANLVMWLIAPALW